MNIRRHTHVFGAQWNWWFQSSTSRTKLSYSDKAWLRSVPNLALVPFIKCYAGTYTYLLDHWLKTWVTSKNNRYHVIKPFLVSITFPIGYFYLRNLSQEFDFNPKFDFGRKKLRSQISAANGMHIGTLVVVCAFGLLLKEIKWRLCWWGDTCWCFHNMTTVTETFLGFFSKGWLVRIAMHHFP